VNALVTRSLSISLVVQLKRQEELTRTIQGRRAKANAENPEKERRKVAIIEAA
jgi:hypothetical protein